MEHRRTSGGVINPIEHQAMPMKIQIGSGSKTLEKSDSVGCNLRAFQSRLFDQSGGEVVQGSTVYALKDGNGALGDLQHR